MKLIGYTPYSDDFSEPGDRRRLVNFAKRTNYPLEIADPKKDYSIVYITTSADIPFWTDYKRKRGDKCRLIVELIDSYFAEDFNFKAAIRPLARYATGQFSRLSFNYKAVLAEACRTADAVVCSTEEQRKDIAKYCDNIHLILDFFDDDLNAANLSHDKYSDDRIHVAWEGQPYTLDCLLVIADTLKEMGDEIKLHVMTDTHFYRFSKKYFRRETKDVFAKVGLSVDLQEWTRSTFAENISRCHLAIIPIDLNNKFYSGKPENKLVLLWKIGVPVLVSPSPCYRRVMENLGLPEMCCHSPEDWKDKIRRYGNIEPSDLSKINEKISKFVADNYSSQALESKWQRLFASL